MKSTSKASLFRQLPSVDELVRREELGAMVAEQGPAAVAVAARSVLSDIRSMIAAGKLDGDHLTAALTTLPAAIRAKSAAVLTPSLVPVINATGVILHTNLGRAPFPAAALERIGATAGGYSNLELDVTTGQRGERDAHVDRLFARLLPNNPEPGTVSTIVVNNNAAALLLAINTLAEGGEVIVSRGELIEIGGSFRVPEIMGKSNAVLREVGTTNRTRLSDYESAIRDRTKLLLRVHRSNFAITGFAEQPSLRDLASLSRKRQIPLLEDLGSGKIGDLPIAGLGDEPSVAGSLEAGVNVVAYSGDKLLGGPQAGMLSGASPLIARMRSNPLFRALRVDKLTYAALEATLLVLVKQEFDAIPILRMMRLSKNEITRRAEAFRARITAPNLQVELMEGESAIGGGAAPATTLPTCLLAIEAARLTASELMARLRAWRPPILARVEQEKVLLDLRTVFREQEEQVAEAFLSLAASLKETP